MFLMTPSDSNASLASSMTLTRAHWTTTTLVVSMKDALIAFASDHSVLSVVAFEVSSFC